MDDELASVRGVVDLSPHEALDEAQEFLGRQGYSVTYRTTTTLTVKRQVSDNATGQESIFKLIVMALPESGGGVRIKVEGNDREAVRDHQAAWLEWSETLPKRGRSSRKLRRSLRGSGNTTPNRTQRSANAKKRSANAQNVRQRQTKQHRARAGEVKGPSPRCWPRYFLWSALCCWPCSQISYGPEKRACWRRLSLVFGPCASS